MVLRTVGRTVRQVRDFAGRAYRTAQDMAPGIRKGADAIRRGFAEASDNGLLDQVGGKRSADIRRGAQRAFATYDKFEEAAKRGDQVVRAMRS